MSLNEIIENLNEIRNNTNKIYSNQIEKKNEYLIILNNLRNSYNLNDNKLIKLRILYLIKIILRRLINNKYFDVEELQCNIESLKEKNEEINLNIHGIIENITNLDESLVELDKISINSSYYENQLKTKSNLFHKIKHDEYKLDDKDESVIFVKKNKKYLK